MNVDFNNLRLQTAFALDNVIKTLNNGIMPENGTILIDVSDIEKDIKWLRSNVFTMLCVYEEGNENFKMMADELDKNGGLENFNPNEE